MVLLWISHGLIMDLSLIYEIQDEFLEDPFDILLMPFGSSWMMLVTIFRYYRSRFLWELCEFGIRIRWSGSEHFSPSNTPISRRLMHQSTFNGIANPYNFIH